MLRRMGRGIRAALGATAAALIAAIIVGAGPTPIQVLAAKASPRTTATASRSVATTVPRPVTTVAVTPPATPPATSPPTTVVASTTVPVVNPVTAPPPTEASFPASTLGPAGTFAPQSTYPVITPPPTPAPTTTSTTIPSIRGHIPVPPSTVPLQTKALSTHISPVFPALSGAGFFVALIMMATRFVMTRPRRKG